MTEKTNNQNKINSNGCKDFVENILPEKVILHKRNSAYSIYSWVWSDEQKNYVSYDSLRFGNKEGENKNYLYANINSGKNIDHWETFEYEQDKVSSDGTIEKTIEIIIGYVVLELTGNEKPTANPTLFEVDSKITDYKILKCEI